MKLKGSKLNNGRLYCDKFLNINEIKDKKDCIVCRFQQEIVIQGNVPQRNTL